MCAAAGDDDCVTYTTMKLRAHIVRVGDSSGSRVYINISLGYFKKNTYHKGFSASLTENRFLVSKVKMSRSNWISLLARNVFLSQKLLNRDGKHEFWQCFLFGLP